MSAEIVEFPYSGVRFPGYLLPDNSVVIRFPGHKWFHCNPATCYGCMFCHGGLGACVTCGGFEGSLTTDCPQVKCEMIVHDEVFAGRIDYDRRRGWYKKERIDVGQG